MPHDARGQNVLGERRSFGRSGYTECRQSRTELEMGSSGEPNRHPLDPVRAPRRGR